MPSLLDSPCADGLYWQRHVAAVALALRDGSPRTSVALVAHSGAGSLLPAIGAGFRQLVAGYVFVDAGLPGKHGQSRLDLFEPAGAQRFRAGALDGIISRVWRNDAVLLAAGITDEDLRHRFASEVPDLPLAVYEEPLPVPDDWPDAPCGYLQFSAPYEADARAVVPRGWPVRELPGGHLHMLADPAAVADALLDLAREMGI